jgi:acyl-coenzyme A synthetase/AMP-(fatty) acid ligase
MRPTVVVVDSLPRNVTGKVQKDVLRQLHSGPMSGR